MWNKRRVKRRASVGTREVDLRTALFCVVVLATLVGVWAALTTG